MPQSFSDLESKLDLVARATPLVQIDIMDGKFVKTKSWPYYASDRASLEKLLTESDGLPHWDKLDFEIDLMVSKPEGVIGDWITIGAKRLVIHVESTKNLKEIIQTLKERSVDIGLALNPSTPTDKILPYLEDIQFVQFMGIDTIGIQGEPFDESVFDKMREFHNAHPEIVISVDGGVDFDNAKDLVEAGAKRLVSGSAIFESGDVAGAVKHFKDLVW